MNNTYQQLAELMRLFKEVDDVYEGYATSQGIPESMFWILYATHTREDARPYTQKELCREWSETPQTVNSAIKKMQERGLVKLIALPENKREKGIVLTESGQNLAQKIIHPLASSEIRAWAAVPEDDRLAVMQALATYRKALVKELENQPCNK